MDRLTENKLVLVVRHTRLDDLIARFNTESQARFYIEHLGGDFSDYQREDQRYKEAVRAAENALAALGRLQTIDRSYVPNFIFGAQDTVIALGQDGLVANTLKYLDGQLLLGVNPDPERWEGVLLPFSVPQLGSVLPQVFARQREVRLVSMAQVSLNTGERLLGVNDLFIGPRSHTSARYTIHSGDRSESHSSSGVIVSTGLGSTGWLRSILAGATGITASLGGAPGVGSRNPAFAWDADYLFFSVREPWPSRTSTAQITFGKVTPEQPLVLTSQMSENGVIFSDGIESDFLQFNSGTVATVSLSGRKGALVV